MGKHFVGVRPEGPWRLNGQIIKLILLVRTSRDVSREFLYLDFYSLFLKRQLSFNEIHFNVTPFMVDDIPNLVFSVFLRHFNDG